MKKLFNIFLLCTLLILTLSVIVSAEKEGYYTYTISNGKVTITDVDTKISGDIVIPSTLGGCPVAKIGDKAFYNCDTLTSVEIPDSLTTIGDGAFSFCYRLTSIVIPESVILIGDSAFYRCDSLTSIMISKGNNNYSSENGVLFNKNKTVLIQYPVKKSDVLYSIPDSVTTISEHAFFNCDNLTRVVISGSVTTISESAFANCNNLTSIVIPGNVTTIGDMTFYLCTSLTSVEIGDRVTTIGKYAFRDCDSLTSIEIPDSVTTIGSSAFVDCDSLTRVVIGDSVITIGDGAFSSCYKLKSIALSENNNYYCSEAGVLFNKDKTTLVKYPSGKTAEAYIIPDSVTAIGDSAFYNCYRLTSIVIPDSVTTIGDDVFYNTLWYNNQPDGLVYAGKVLYKYKGTMPLNTTIVIKDGTKGIAGKAFYNCDNLTSIEIPDSVTTIGNRAFYSCDSLTSVEIPDSVTTIGNGTFSACDHLIFITVSENNDNYSLENGVLFNKDKTTLIQYPTAKNDVTYTIPDSVTTIGEYAFSYYDKLTSIKIPDSVTTIGNRAFYSCDSLTSVEIPDSVSTIGNGAFSDCYKLTTVYYRGNDQQWYEITIGENNDYLTSADIFYSAVKIKAYDKTNTVLVDKWIDSTTATYNSLFGKQGYATIIYTDNTFTCTIDADSYITEDIEVYVDYEMAIEISGTKGFVPNDSFEQNMYFSTDKKANYLICEIIYPDVLELNSITPRQFKYATKESLKNKDGFNHLTVICQYADDESTVPQNTSINPFDISFNVSKTAKPQEIEIRFGEDTYLSGDEDYVFENKIGAKIKILPKLASSVTITGESTIYAPTKYIAEVSPDYTTDKTITWTVSDETVATISKDGVLTPLKNGTVIITATAVGGAYTTKAVTVYRNAFVDSFKSDCGIWNESILPDKKEYTVYVTEDTEVIKITPCFTTGALKYNGVVVMKNRAKEFELTATETTIALERTDSEYEACTYTIKVIKKSGLKNETISKDSFKEDCLNILVYKGNVQTIKDTEDVTITMPSTVKSYKILYLESLNTLKPLYTPITKEL